MKCIVFAPLMSFPVFRMSYCFKIKECLVREFINVTKKLFSSETFICVQITVQLPPHFYVINVDPTNKIYGFVGR